jgi:O-methyltransferase
VVGEELLVLREQRVESISYPDAFRDRSSPADYPERCVGKSGCHGRDDPLCTPVGLNEVVGDYRGLPGPWYLRRFALPLDFHASQHRPGVVSTRLSSGAGPCETEWAERYLNLLARALTHTLYPGSDSVPFTSQSRLRKFLLGLLRRRGFIRIVEDPDREADRVAGKDWPLFAQTMVGLTRLKNLRSCIEAVVAEDVPGDIIETGVWRGGAGIYARAVLLVLGVTDRTVWAADSFRGLPPPSPTTYPADAGTVWHTGDHLAVPLEEVKDNFRRYGVLDDQVRFLEGWFRDTLPTVRDRSWAIVRLDGDMYESTTDALVNLYPGLSPRGYLIVDDYQIPECRAAVDDFRRTEAIDEPIQEIDWTGVFWRKRT